MDTKIAIIILFRYLGTCKHNESSGVRCFGVRGLRINNSVPMAGYTRQKSIGSGGMLHQEIFHFHIFLERSWCILSIILVEKYLLRILETYLYRFIGPKFIVTLQINCNTHEQANYSLRHPLRYAFLHTAILLYNIISNHRVGRLYK